MTRWNDKSNVGVCERFGMAGNEKGIHCRVVEL